MLFCDSHSYMRGVAAGVIDIKCDCFHKLVSFTLLRKMHHVRELFRLILIRFYVKMRRVHIVDWWAIYFVAISIVFDRIVNNAGWIIMGQNHLRIINQRLDDNMYCRQKHQTFFMCLFISCLFVFFILKIEHCVCVDNYTWTIHRYHRLLLHNITPRTV